MKLVKAIMLMLSLIEVAAMAASIAGGDSVANIGVIFGCALITWALTGIMLTLPA